MIADLERLLKHETVEARPPTQLYRMRKAIRRNKTAVAAGAVVMIALVLGTVISVWQALRATKANRAAQAARDASEHQVYLAKIGLAQRAWEQNEIDRLRDLVAQTAPTPDKNFEWFYWKKQTELALKVYRGHEWQIQSMSVAGAGDIFITASEDGTAKIWDVNSGEVLRTFHQGGWAWTAIFSPDGKFALTAGAGNEANLWDVSTGAKVRQILEEAGEIEGAAFSRSGEFVAMGTRIGNVNVREVKSGSIRVRLPEHGERAAAVQFSPDDSLLATGGSGQTLRLHKAINGEEASAHRMEGEISSIAFSRDGKRLLLATGKTTARRT